MARNRPRRPGKPSTPPRRTAGSALAWAVLIAIAIAAAHVATPAAGQPSFDPTELTLDQEPVFSLDSPIGPVEYRLGRGLHLGRTGLHIGGFTTLEYEDEEGEPGAFAVDSVNFLVLLQPVDFFRGFLELEVGDLFRWETDSNDVDHDPDVVVERVFGDLMLDDALAVRLGKFQTPVGRWNLVPAEPFTWTAHEPVVAETAFDEHTTGGGLLGTFYPGPGSLRYWVYGQFFDPLDPSEDPDPADHSVGGRLQFDESLGDWSVGTSFLATEIDGDWSYLGGLDAEWQIGPLLLTSELTLQRGDIPDRELWSVYAQGVWELLPRHLPNVFLTGRFEHFDRIGSGDDANLGDIGITWIPRPFLRLKAGYRFSDEQTEDVADGVKVTFSFVF